MKEQIWQDAYDKLKKENKELKNAFNEIEILSKKQIYGCVYGQEGVFYCKLNHSQCDKCLAEEVIKITDKALNKTSHSANIQ